MSMSYLLGKLNLKAFRYCVLVVFLVCSALVTSISVWNLGLVRDSETSDRTSSLGVDSYSTFLGCSGLIMCFTIAFVEIAQVSCFIALVWFECLWVSLWGLMYLAAGTTLSVVASQENCHINDSHSKCISTQVLLAFTWFGAVSLLIYLCVFMFAVFINKKKDATIWLSIMRKFPWSGTCVMLASSPITPPVVEAGFQSGVPIIRAPKPKHARPNPNRREPIFSWRSGLSNEYQIEHFRPPNVEGGPSPMASLPPAATAPIIRASVLPALGANAEDNFASSLYPPFLQHTVFAPGSGSTRPQPALNQPPTRAITRAPQSLPQATPVLSPPPLGNWPRADIISRGAGKGKRKEASLSHNISAFVASPAESILRQERPDLEEGQSHTPSSFTPLRPMVPQRRSGSSDMTNRAPR